MNDLDPMVFGVGVQDGLNPCIFMSCAVFIIYGHCLKSLSLPVFWLRIVFLLVYALGVFAFNFGPTQVFVFQKIFMLASKAIYFVLGVGAFVLGILFLKEWFLLSRGLPVNGITDQKIKSFPAAGPVIFLATVILAVLLSAMATLWPINTYFMLLGNEALINGQWHRVISLLAGYILSSMWPLWLVWGFFSIKNLRPSLVRILCAAVFFIASTTVIFIFK